MNIQTLDPLVTPGTAASSVNKVLRNTYAETVNKTV